jgi:hypothetical protein
MNKVHCQRDAARIQAYRSELEALQWDRFHDLDERNRDRLAAYHQRLMVDLASRYGFGSGDGEVGKRLSPKMSVLAALGALTLFVTAYCLYHAVAGAPEGLWLALCR